ncbi:DUF4868 domain-containing protein [Clostridium botulinum]|nr:DUF4868 domain-containing protein [Clostridium botulinum]NFK70058.1 DUF4868 domain-containing protein [Clostridium botulinum]NFK98164.1 DUF4868 domain-containing protein [Clostridium botulinum]
MNKDKLIGKIGEFTKENSTLSLQLGHKENKDYFFLQAGIDDKVQKTIFKLLKDEILSIIRNNELVEFDAVGKQDDTIEKINVSDVDGYLILKNERNDNTNFAENLKILKEINFYLLEIINENSNIKIFRRYSKSKSLSKGIILKALESNFDRIKENIFQIDNIVDFIVINDEIIVVFNRYAFEIITNYKDNYIENLESALNKISSSNLINNMDQFKEDCKNSMRIAKQFTKAMQESSISLILSNLEHVGDAIREAELPIEFINNKFQYESREQLSILVALLSDRYAKTLIGNRITN